MKKIKLILTAAIYMIVFAGCSNSKGSHGRFIFKSGNFQNIHYIMITKKKGFKKKYILSMEPGKYKKGAGNSSFMSKETYSGRSFSSYHLIRDSAMLLSENASLNVDRTLSDISKISDEEYIAIKEAFLKYPSLAGSYSLNADSIKKYIGWYKLP